VITKQDSLRLQQDFKKVFVTKQDIVQLRKDFEKIFATKQELKMLDDSLLATRIEMLARLDTQDEKIAEFRNDMLTSFSEVMGELKAMREEHAVAMFRQREHSDQLENHEGRLIKVESKLVN
jgi:hypothetical protein